MATFAKRHCGIPFRAGVTLLEILISIFIIGALLSILLPALGGVRPAAGATKSLANLRSIGQTLALYNAANADEFPFDPPGEPVRSVPPGYEMGEPVGFAPIWGLENMWPITMHEVAPWEKHWESWLSPGRSMPEDPWPISVGFFHEDNPPGEGPPVSYSYSNSFIGDPLIWTEGAIVSEEQHVRPVRVGEVVHPSLKVVMYDWERAYLRHRTPETPRPVLVVDGAAFLRVDSESTYPVVNPFYHRSPRRYHDTLEGVRGRDF